MARNNEKRKKLKMDIVGPQIWRENRKRGK